MPRALLPFRRLVLSTWRRIVERRGVRNRRCRRSVLGEKPRLSSRLEDRAAQLWRTVPRLHGRRRRRVRRRAPRGPVARVVEGRFRVRSVASSSLALPPHRHEPRLLLSGLAGRPEVVTQLFEPCGGDEGAPPIEVPVAAVALSVPAFAVVAPRVGGEKNAAG